LIALDDALGSIRRWQTKRANRDAVVLRRRRRCLCSGPTHRQESTMNVSLAQAVAANIAESRYSSPA
jgi:hypothetical protein